MDVDARTYSVGLPIHLLGNPHGGLIPAFEDKKRAFPILEYFIGNAKTKGSKRRNASVAGGPFFKMDQSDANSTRMVR
jgi:hypothetical protein